MHRRLAAVVCIFAGHRWTPTDSAYPDQVLLRCRRCAATSIVSSEMIETESYSEKWTRREVADNPYLDPRDFDTRLPRRR